MVLHIKVDDWRKCWISMKGGYDFEARKSGQANLRRNISAVESIHERQCKYLCDDLFFTKG